MGQMGPNPRGGHPAYQGEILLDGEENLRNLVNERAVLVFSWRCNIKLAGAHAEFMRAAINSRR